MNGIKVTNASYGPILSGNIIAANNDNGVYIGDGSTVGVVRGNLISGNGGSGIVLSNTNRAQSITKTTIVTNSIVSNAEYSIWLNVDNGTVISSTVIGGNTISDNKYGLGSNDSFNAYVRKVVFLIIRIL